MNIENKLKIDDFTKALAECINQAQCAVVDPMAHAEIWKEELFELAKGKEPVSEDLEKEIDKFFKDWGTDEINGGQYGINLDVRELKDIARHFANWQREQGKIVEKLMDRNYAKGFDACKQQIMKEAVDGQLENGDDYLRIKCLSMGCQPQDDGKFVKLIIIKED